MRTHDMLEDRMLYILYTCGIVFFLVRIIGYLDGSRDDLISNPDWIEGMSKIQVILEVLITVTFIWSVIPRWVNKIKSTPLQKTVQMGCTIVGCIIIFTVVPMVTGVQFEFTDMKIIGMVIALAVIGVFYIIAYRYGQKHKNDDKGGKDNEDDDRGSESPGKED